MKEWKKERGKKEEKAGFSETKSLKYCAFALCELHHPNSLEVTVGATAVTGS